MTIWSHENPVPGRFNDGAFPVDREVLVRQSLGELHIEDKASGEVLARWPLGVLRPVPDAQFPDVLRLKQSDGEGGRLAIFDRAFNEGLTEWWPNLRRRLVMDRATLHDAGRTALAAVVGLGLFFLILAPVLGRLASYLVPPALEQRAASVFLRHGDAQLQRIEAARVCDAEAVAPILEKLVEPLRKASGWPETIRVRVIDDPQPNAATIPGGEIVVFRGMLYFARSADELAGILAHEIGHVVRRHAVRSLFVTSLNFFGFDQLLGNFSGQLVVHPISGGMLGRREARGAEHEADQAAVKILDKAGYNARPLADILERVGYLQGEKEVAEGWLATHPLSHSRARRIRDIAPVEPRPSALTAPEFSRLRAICAPQMPAARARESEERPASTLSDNEPPEVGKDTPPSESPERSPEGSGPESGDSAETRSEQPEKPDLKNWDTGG